MFTGSWCGSGERLLAKGSRGEGLGLQVVRELVAPGVAGVRRPRNSFRRGSLAAQGETNLHDKLGTSLNLYRLYRFLHSCKSEGGTRRCT